MAEHTKGPWRVDNSGARTYVTNETATLMICEVPNLHPQREGNASLIAAAPDMLSALVMVLEGHENGEPLEEHGLRAVENAIKKAKGENHG